MLRGLRHRTVIDEATGAQALALWQEEHLSGFEVPPHYHDCEEIITVLEGRILAWIEGEERDLGPGESFLILKGKSHGFRVTSDSAVKLLALFSSPRPGIFRVDGTRTIPPWEGGASDHLKVS